MRLSIIIPVYNEAPFLKRCLDSIPYSKECELIIIDDGSTDGSSDICDLYSDRGSIAHWWPNQGVSAARNHGLDLASGEWVTFLDSDDRYLPDSLEYLLNGITFAERKEIDIIQFNQYRFYDKVGFPRRKYTNKKGLYSWCNPPQQWCMVWNKAYRRAFLEENHIRFKEGLQYGEDELFNIGCLFSTDYIWHAEERTLIRHFDNKESIVHNMSIEKILAQDEALRELLGSLNDEDQIYFLKNLINEHRKSQWYKDILGDELCEI